MIFNPIQPDSVASDRDYVVVLSDWTFQDEEAMIGRLKKEEGYFISNAARCGSSSRTWLITAGVQPSTTI